MLMQLPIVVTYIAEVIDIYPYLNVYSYLYTPSIMYIHSNAAAANYTTRSLLLANAQVSILEYLLDLANKPSCSMPMYTRTSIYSLARVWL